MDILDTPVSPELLPPKEGEIAQKTEDLVGPYELHDFYLYYMMRFGYAPVSYTHLFVQTASKNDALIKLMNEEFQAIEVVRGGSVGIEAINMAER